MASCPWTRNVSSGTARAASSRKSRTFSAFRSRSGRIAYAPTPDPAGWLLSCKLRRRLLQVFLGNRTVALLHAQPVGGCQYLADRASLRWSELVDRQLDQRAIGVTEVQRIHEATIDPARVGITRCIQPGYR